MTRDKVPSVLTMLETTMSLEYSRRMEIQAKAAENECQRRPFKPPSCGELDLVRQFAVAALEPDMMYMPEVIAWNTTEIDQGSTENNTFVHQPQ